MINKIGKGAVSVFSNIGRTIGALSPIDLFRKDQGSKIASFAHKQMAKASGVLEKVDAVGSITKRAAARMKTNVSLAVGNIKGTNPDIARGLSDYMKGYTLGAERTSMAPGTLKFNSMARKGAAGALGLYAGSKIAFGSDNPISNTIGGTAHLGVHAAIGTSIYKNMSKGWGMAYGAATAVNALRPGNSYDHMGPM